MTHIANCMRRTFDKPDSVYIMEETPTLFPISGNIIPEDITETLEKPDHLLEGRARQSFKYQLWPRPTKGAQVFTPTPLSDKTMALAMGRSPTSLSDTSLNLEKHTVFWRRGGSLSNRRKISVPELSSNAQMTTLQEGTMDSPTIPGRPPLRKVSSADVRHERSSSAPTWRDCAFGDAMMTMVTVPKVDTPFQPPVNTPWPLSAPQQLPATTYNPTRPLSPILSPAGSATPTTAIHVPTKGVTSPKDIPPKVPPKSPLSNLASSPPKHILRHSPSKLLKRSPSKSTLPTIATTKPASPELASSPPNSITNSPSTATEARMSPTRKIKHSPSPSKESVSDATVMDRGRPIKRAAKKLNSHPLLEPNNEPEPNNWSLPAGLKPLEALLLLPEPEKEQLRKQATGQAERFEVLGSKHVEALSRELRALDERCEYLRKTYKSLRSGRQKLHQRMITYLKSESISFSRERLLKQEEALIELDKSIDDWIIKLEGAENRRLRVRQKLLEHVAAAMTLNAAAMSPKPIGQTTPPGSPPRLESPSPLHPTRKEVESIKVYADNQVLNLFNDIERAVERMCEAC